MGSTDRVSVLHWLVTSAGPQDNQRWWGFIHKLAAEQSFQTNRGSEVVPQYIDVVDTSKIQGEAAPIVNPITVTEPEAYAFIYGDA
mmetsp:Transcript_32486/g.103439  ORF Transcript_32486/g.103439 Transcript_32486/m.103439 type:complete len:86 (+) Transcript_32486:40-297(+)